MTTDHPELKPCPLCEGKAHDKGFGIVCTKCGLWLGDGTLALGLGGYKKVWNTRPDKLSS